MNQSFSLERVQGYIEIEQEPKPTPKGVPPAYWPASGNVVVEKLSARYSPDGPKVLHDISFEIKSGERVGVGKYHIISLFKYGMILINDVNLLVGRTGSGKVTKIERHVTVQILY